MACALVVPRHFAQRFGLWAALDNRGQMGGAGQGGSYWPRRQLAAFLSSLPFIMCNISIEKFDYEYQEVCGCPAACWATRTRTGVSSRSVVFRLVGPSPVAF